MNAASPFLISAMVLALVPLAGSAARAEDGCAIIARLHKAGLAPTVSKDAGDDLNGRALAPAKPEAPLGQCWKAKDGAAWGLIISNVEASISGWDDEDKIALVGDVIVVRVATDGTVVRQRVGAYVEGPMCENYIRAELVQPPEGLLVDVTPQCGDSAMEHGAHWLVARDGKLVQPAADLEPLVVPEDSRRTIHSLKHFAVTVPGGHAGTYTQSFPVPYRVGDDGTIGLDAAALRAACDGQAWSALDDPSEDADADELISAFACDWFRGVQLAPAIKRAKKGCKPAPKRRASESDDDYEWRVFEASADEPAICQVAARLLKLAGTKPPALNATPAPTSTPRPVELGYVPVVGQESVPVVPRFKDYTFGADHLSDGQLDTSWQPRSKRPHFGQWARLNLAGPARVDAVEIANGFQRTDKLGDLFTLNDRLVGGWIVLSSGDAVPFTLDPKRLGFQSVAIVPARTTSSVTFVVAEGAGGERWDQLAVSEIRVKGAQTGSVPDAAGIWGELSAALIAHCGVTKAAAECRPALESWLVLGADAGEKLIEGAGDARKVKLVTARGKAQELKFARKGKGWTVNIGAPR